MKLSFGKNICLTISYIQNNMKLAFVGVDNIEWIMHNLEKTILILCLRLCSPAGHRTTGLKNDHNQSIVFPVYVSGLANCWRSLLCFIVPLSFKKLNFIVLWFWYSIIKIWGFLMFVLWERQLCVSEKYTWFFRTVLLFLFTSVSCQLILIFSCLVSKLLIVFNICYDIAYYVKYYLTNSRTYQKMVINCSNKELIGYTYVKIPLKLGVIV